MSFTAGDFAKLVETGDLGAERLEELRLSETRKPTNPLCDDCCIDGVMCSECPGRDPAALLAENDRLRSGAEAWLARLPPAGTVMVQLPLLWVQWQVDGMPYENDLPFDIEDTVAAACRAALAAEEAPPEPLDGA